MQQVLRDSAAYSSLRTALSILPSLTHLFFLMADEEYVVLTALQILPLKLREGRLSEIIQLVKESAKVKPKPSGQRRKIFWIVL